MVLIPITYYYYIKLTKANFLTEWYQIHEYMLILQYILRELMCVYTLRLLMNNASMNSVGTFNDWCVYD